MADLTDELGMNGYGYQPYRDEDDEDDEEMISDGNQRIHKTGFCYR